jgi:7,8-dihydropterin-6-yl-methyl-4-(beta-D-ribofuranosyl)aminobenzene 5'-phosphate synthase
MIRKVKLTVLAEDTKSALRRNLTSKHGLSILVEGEIDTQKFSLLMDTGPSPNVVLHNVKAMDIDLDEMRLIFISHGHYDHTGGLIGILKHINKKVPVIAHPQTFDVKLKFEPILKYIGTPFKLSDVEASGGIVLLARNPVTIANGIMTTGEVERRVDYEKVERFWTIKGEKFGEDTMPDDQALIININGKGLVILSGCAHSGIINTIRHAQKVTGVNKIFAVLGGFHLMKADDSRIKKTINDFLKIEPELVGPCHCTGSRAVRWLSQAFGDYCQPLRTGDTIEL